MNAHTERFNRTIQEEFIEFNKDLLFDDINAFNDKLLDYLNWFNEDKPYYALGLRSPMQFLAEEHQCNMYWQETKPNLQLVLDYNQIPLFLWCLLQRPLLPSGFGSLWISSPVFLRCRCCFYSWRLVRTFCFIAIQAMCLSFARGSYI